MTEPVYKWLNGRKAPLAPGFRYRLGEWMPAIEGELEPCVNAYHGARVDQLTHWITHDLYVIESRAPWLHDADKLYTRGPVRIVEHLRGWSERTARLFAADCAERVLPVWEERHPNDDRPRRAIQAARDYVNGLIGREELAAARVAARAAAAAAADSGAWAAAATLRLSARHTAAYAARAVAHAAADERRWQGERILDYAYGRLG